MSWRDRVTSPTYRGGVYDKTVSILELMSKPAPKAETTQASKGALELTGKAAVVAGDPVIDQYRRKLSMALF